MVIGIGTVGNSMLMVHKGELNIGCQEVIGNDQK